MNWEQIEGKWQQMKGDAKAQWGKLTDDDVERAEGNREKLEGILYVKYGNNKDVVHDEVDAWMKKAS